MKVQAQAPANIAFIKYMGKLESNLPTNPSLSYTLLHFVSDVELEETKANEDSWEAYDQAEPFYEKEISKFLDFLKVLKSRLEIKTGLIVRSKNNFPKSCGLASSASSFAALTMAASKLSKKDLTLEQLAKLSREGSGSSCRSFFSPWALWEKDRVSALDLNSKWNHEVLVVDRGEKSVSSSLAHQRVKTSPLFQGRAERAESRLKDFVNALKEENWEKAFDTSWSEFWDMHALFETSMPSFGYMTPKTIEVLKVFREARVKKGFAPLVTMDAGANIHILYQPEWTDFKDSILRDIKTDFQVLK